VCQAKSDYRILCVQLSGVKWGCGPRKGAEVETVSGGLILPEEGEIEEIRVELSLGPISFFKNQAGWPSL